MNKIHMLAALGALAFASGAQAQSCPCNGGKGTLLTTSAATQAVLANKMVCAQVGNERWQEWHNGSTSGPVVDYKLGPGHPVDPSSNVGTYAIAADGTITYSYGGTPYRYAVCQTSGTYAFCGAAFNGRDILGAAVSSSGGLQSCSGAGNTGSRTRKP